MSEKHPDKLINEGVFTIFNELDSIRNELKAMLKPNGSQQAPARSCYDLFLCNPSFEEGYYWIDPNVGNPRDAIQVYCSRPGCSCLDCETPDNSAQSQNWPGVKDSLFSSLGQHMTCPISVDQLSLLRLLSSNAHQVFTLHNSKTQVDFYGTEGKEITDVSKEPLGKSRTDFILRGEPEWLPLEDFIPHDDTFGFELGRACFCNQLEH